MVESLLQDVGYAIRGLRRSPIFVLGVAATIGLGLGLLGAAFTIVNAYVFRTVDLSDPHSLYELSWDTQTRRRERFRLADVTALRGQTRLFEGVAAGQAAVAMHDGVALNGLLVSGDYFQVLGGRPTLGRLLTPDDARAPGASPVVVLSDWAWRAHFGADPAIVGRRIDLGRRRFDVVGVAPPGFGLAGQEIVGFWAPLTMAGAFSGPNPWSDPAAHTLFAVVRLRKDATSAQLQSYFESWLRREFAPPSERAPVLVRVESRATRILLNGAMMTVVALLLSAFGLVLLVACANVTNLLLARALARQQEIAVRLSLGASRLRVARQLIVESLVLAVPAAAIGLALTMATVRIFPALVLSTFPSGFIRVEAVLIPLDVDARVMMVLFVAAVAAAALVSIVPASRLTRTDLVRASRGESSLDPRRSRFRTGLVAMQIGACVLFLVGAAGLIDQARQLAGMETGIDYEQVADVRVAPRLRADVAARLAGDPAVERVAAAWRPPFIGGALPEIGVSTTAGAVTRNAGFAVVSPEFFSVFGIDLVGGRTFTAQEANDDAAVVLVSAATARTLWPGLDPIGQTLDVLPPSGRAAQRRPRHTSVRVIGVTEDVISSSNILDGVDETVVYFVTGFNSADELSVLVRSRVPIDALRANVTAAVAGVDPDAPFGFYGMESMMAGMRWIFQALSTVALLVGGVGLLFALSGTYAVVSFLVTQRTREFGVRMALGATVGRIVGELMTETGRIAAIGIGAGLLIAVGLIRLFDAGSPIVPAFGVLHYATPALVVLVATGLAALVPSARAARIQPSHALRAE